MCTSQGHVQSAFQVKSPDQRTHYKMASQCPTVSSPCDSSEVWQEWNVQRGICKPSPVLGIAFVFIVSARIAALGPLHAWWLLSVPFSPDGVNAPAPPLSAAALSFLFKAVLDPSALVFACSRCRSGFTIGLNPRRGLLYVCSVCSQPVHQTFSCLLDLSWRTARCDL